MVSLYNLLMFYIKVQLKILSMSWQKHKILHFLNCILEIRSRYFNVMKRESFCFRYWTYFQTSSVCLSFSPRYLLYKSIPYLLDPRIFPHLEVNTLFFHLPCFDPSQSMQTELTEPGFFVLTGLSADPQTCSFVSGRWSNNPSPSLRFKNSCQTSN